MIPKKEARKTINMTLSASGTRIGVYVKETGQHLFRVTDPGNVIQDAISLAKLNITTDMLHADICLTFPAGIQTEDVDVEGINFIENWPQKGEVITFRRYKLLDSSLEVTK